MPLSDFVPALCGGLCAALLVSTLSPLTGAAKVATALGAAVGGVLGVWCKRHLIDGRRR